MTHQTSLEPKTARRTAAFAAFMWSLTAIPIGLWQLLSPDTGPFTHEGRQPTVLLPDSLPDGTAPALLIASGVAGLLLARGLPRTWPLTALFAVVFGLLVPSMHLLSLAGYLCAFFMPIALITGPVLLAKGRAAKLLAAAAVAAVVTVFLTGPLNPGVLAELGRNLGTGLVRVGIYPIAELWSAVGGAIWAILTFRILQRRYAGRPAPDWLAPERAARWGKVAAIVAFACSLPYGLTRLTWLTPWTFLADNDILNDDPSIRMWGLLLGASALGGGVLCLGLIQRWGERWPYWVPVLHGRPVPPKVAIVPASIIAFLFTLSGIGLLANGIREDMFLLSMIFPMWAWGPALAAATLAYAIRRGVVRTTDEPAQS